MKTKSMKLKCNIYYKLIFLLLIFIFIYFKNNIKEKNRIIQNNFFIIDSNNLEIIESHMYGYSISKKGILTNNYYKKLGYYEEPGPLGAYIMIRKIGNEIWLNQDYNGCFGLYIYENKTTGYFAISNSFLLLEEYLIGKQNITLNKDFADNFIIAGLCTPSIYETMIKEIICLPANVFLIIDIKNRSYKSYNFDYKENSVPLESDEGLKIIDRWVDKWGYILHSLKKKIDFQADLSGGFDSRIIFSILLNSGIDVKDLTLGSIIGKRQTFVEDYKIASKISSKFGLKLNRYFDMNGTNLNAKDSLLCTIYTKLGFHKEFYISTKFYTKPRFHVRGSGGGLLRGYPCQPIEKYIDQISSEGKQIKGYGKEFYNSSIRLCKRSLFLIKSKKAYYSKNLISSVLYAMGRNRNHFGKANIEAYLTNSYTIQPLIDPEIRQIKFDQNHPYDLVAYLYVRFARDLIFFPIQGNRILSYESIRKADKLNKKFDPYSIKKDYNKNFYIDTKRKSPVAPSNETTTVEEYLRKMFNSSKFKETFNKLYDNVVYDWAKEYSKKSNYHPLRHGYGLYAVVKILEDLSLNEKIFNQKKANK